MSLDGPVFLEFVRASNVKHFPWVNNGQHWDKAGRDSSEGLSNSHLQRQQVISVPSVVRG